VPKTSPAELGELRDSMRAFFENVAPALTTDSRAGGHGNVDRALWARLAGEIQAPGLVLPESWGGQGYGMAEGVVLVEEAARALVPAPVASSCVLAATAAARAGDRRLAAGLAAGTRIAVPVLDSGLTAKETPAGWAVSGRADAVVDAPVATTFLLACDGGVFVVDDGVEVDALEPFDPTRTMGSVRFESSPARRLETVTSAELNDLAAIVAAAELAGVADRALSMAVEHARTRVQFGRPIGSFQAVKHLCAEMLAVAECARAAVSSAARAADDDPGRMPEAASVAKAYCSDACPSVVEALIQVLGGIGFTWEHPAHLLLRRARTLAALNGSAAQHRRRLAGLLGLRAPAGDHSA
jgi:alkylation response protein AidB-like acyl-CoA dehydrogenase